MSALYGKSIGEEARYRRKDVLLGPGVNICRTPLNGRSFEYMGEDPYLSGRMVVPYVKGVQSNGVAACVKHFAAYGAPTAGRDYNNVELSERTLRDDYLPAYEAALKAGALLVMTSFNTLNRIPSSANKWLMRQVLREEMGFKGTVISDWAAIEEIMYHGAAMDRKEAARLALEAGTDIDMMTTCYANYLKELIEEGKVDEKLLDEAVLRVLELKNKLGLFENPFKDADEEAEKELLLCADHREKAKEAAKETFVLLENNGILPLKKEEKVAFIGPYTEEKAIIGAWSIFAREEDAVSIEEGVTAYGGNAVFEKGCELISEGASIQGMNRLYTGTGMAENREKKLLKAVKAAKEADKVVLCIGEHMAQTGEAASRGDITIPENQITLLEKIAEVNQNIVVVLFSGRPLDLRKVKTLAKAILVVWMPGTEGGSAIAEVLYGETPPSGKLPMSFPYAVGQVPVFYSEFHTGRRMDPAHPENRFQSRYMDIPNEPLYPFGYGLSYTEFSYSVVTLSKTELIRGGELKASVLLKNVGKSRGSEVVQMYIRDDVGSVARPIRELKGFQKLWLNAGEEKEVSFTITEDMLKFHDINMNNIAEAGKFTVFIGSDSRTQNQAEFVLK